MTATLYCSQCHWSTVACCLLTGKAIARDEDVCADYVKLTIQPIKELNDEIRDYQNIIIRQ